MSHQRQSDRGFGFTFAAFLAVVFAAGWLFFDERLDGVAVGAAIFLAAAVVSPGLLLPLNRLWRGFARRLGKVNNFVVLGLFYYLLMVPLGLIIGLIGRDTMARRRPPGAKSYWSPVKRGATADTFRDLF